MDEKKNFFENLSSKSAFKVGLLSGLAIMFVIGFFIMLGFVLKGGDFAFAKNNNNDDNAAAANNNNAAAPTVIELKDVNKDDWMRGDKKADLSIVEFSDIDCPYCVKFHETMKKLSEEYKGKINWVYRHFPLTSLHPNAFKKAEATECVGSLGGNDKFWPFLDKLVEDKTITMDKLGEVAATFGVNATKFQECYDGGKMTSKVQDQADQAVKAGGRGTPYSVIVFEDQKIPINGALPYEQVKAQIDALLK